MTRWTAVVLIAALLTSVGCAKRYAPPMPHDLVPEKDRGQPQQSAVLDQMLDVLAASAVLLLQVAVLSVTYTSGHGRVFVYSSHAYHGGTLTLGYPHPPHHRAGQ